MGIWLTLGESWHSASSAGDKVTQCNTQSWIHIRDTSASYFGSSKYIIWLKIWTLKSRKRRSSSSFGLILRFFDCFKFMIPTPTCTRGYHAPLPPGESIQLIYGLLVCAVFCGLLVCAGTCGTCVYSDMTRWHEKPEKCFFSRILHPRCRLCYNHNWNECLNAWNIKRP